MLQGETLIYRSGFSDLEIVFLTKLFCFAKRHELAGEQVAQSVLILVHYLIVLVLTARQIFSVNDIYNHLHAVSFPERS